jgi:hypothetical protein
MDSTSRAAQERARYFRKLILEHLRTHPPSSLAQANASVAAELVRVAEAEIEAARRKPR